MVLAAFVHPTGKPLSQTSKPGLLRRFTPGSVDGVAAEAAEEKAAIRQRLRTVEVATSLDVFLTHLCTQIVLIGVYHEKLPRSYALMHALVPPRTDTANLFIKSLDQLESGAKSLDCSEPIAAN